MKYEVFTMCRKHSPRDSVFVTKRMEEGLSYDEAVAELREAENKALEKSGWYAHIVDFDPGKSDTAYNAHTHGFVDTYNHPDFQITLHLPAQTSMSIFSILHHRVKIEGLRFKDGEVSDKVLADYKVKFIKRIESGRPVLRVVMPTEDGKLEQEELTGEYAAQYTVET